MRLWTIQPMDWYERLQQDKLIFGDPKLSEWYFDSELVMFRYAYDWMIEQMERRIGSKPFKGALPIWAWQRYEKKKSKPDLRHTGFLKRGEYGVRLEIEKKEKDILLSDFMLWTHPLNKYYIPSSEEDDKLFAHTLNPFLEKNSLKFGDFEKYSSEIQQKIIKSWELIFDLDFYDEYITHKPEDKEVQATFWSLKLDEVCDVTFFKAR